MHSKIIKSESHARLALEESAEQRAATSRQIARVLGAVPRTRTPKPGLLRRAWRLILRLL